VCFGLEGLWPLPTLSAPKPDKSQLQYALELPRDPSHVRMLPGSELIAILAQSGVTIERQETWDRPRAFEEWVGIVANPERVAPLRTVVRALAMAARTQAWKGMVQFTWSTGGSRL
jgi:hypothetical protein